MRCVATSKKYSYLATARWPRINGHSVQWPWGQDVATNFRPACVNKIFNSKCKSMGWAGRLQRKFCVCTSFVLSRVPQTHSFSNLLNVLSNEAPSSFFLIETPHRIRFYNPISHSFTWPSELFCASGSWLSIECSLFCPFGSSAVCVQKCCLHRRIHKGCIIPAIAMHRMAGILRHPTRHSTATSFIGEDLSPTTSECVAFGSKYSEIVNALPLWRIDGPMFFPSMKFFYEKMH